MHPLFLKYRSHFELLFPGFAFEQSCTVAVDDINNYSLRCWRLAIEQAIALDNDAVDALSLYWLIAQNEAPSCIKRFSTITIVLFDNMLRPRLYSFH